MSIFGLSSKPGELRYERYPRAPLRTITAWLQAWLQALGRGAKETLSSAGGSQREFARPRRARSARRIRRTPGTLDLQAPDRLPLHGFFQPRTGPASLVISPPSKSSESFRWNLTRIDYDTLFATPHTSCCWCCSRKRIDSTVWECRASSLMRSVKNPG